VCECVSGARSSIVGLFSVLRGSFLSVAGSVFRGSCDAPLTAARVGLEISVVIYLEGVFNAHRVELARVIKEVCSHCVVEGARGLEELAYGTSIVS